jgi:hypothetical protein
MKKRLSFKVLFWSRMKPFSVIRKTTAGSQAIEYPDFVLSLLYFQLFLLVSIGSMPIKIARRPCRLTSLPDKDDVTFNPSIPVVLSGFRDVVSCEVLML